MSTQVQTRMELLITEIDTKNSWGKNQLKDTVANMYMMQQVPTREINAITEFIQVIQTKNSWGKNDAKFALLNILAKQISII